MSCQITTSINPTKPPVTAPTSSSSTTPLPSENSWVDGLSSLTTHPMYNNLKPTTTANPTRITILSYYFHRDLCCLSMLQSHPLMLSFLHYITLTMPLTCFYHMFITYYAISYVLLYFAKFLL